MGASLAAATSAAPQIVPYEHVEISAEPYVHIEPELTAEALGIINRSQRPQAAPPAARRPSAAVCAPAAVCPVCSSSGSSGRLDRRLLQQSGGGSSLQAEVLTWISDVVMLTPEVPLTESCDVIGQISSRVAL